MTAYLLVFIGGGLGASLRYMMGIIFTYYLKINYPYGTFIINILGSFLLGLFLMSSLLKNSSNTNLTIFLTVGFTGGFTTFSTFTYEAINLLNQKLFMQSISYVFLSIICSIIGMYVGIMTGKSI